MRLHQREFITALVLTLTALAAGAAPPTDDDVSNALRAYKLACDALDQDGAPLSGYDELKSGALRELSVAEMSSHQLALVYQAQLLFVDDRREVALARLKSLAGEQSIDGAGAAVLRLELEGSSFRIVNHGTQQVYTPEPAAQEQLLAAALGHPALVEAIHRHNAAASMLLSTIAGLNRPDLWEKHRAPIMQLSTLVGPDAPARLLCDTSDYLEVVRTMSTPTQVDDIRRRLATGGAALMRARFHAGAGAIQVLDAESCLDALRELQADAGMIGELRMQVVELGQQALARHDASLHEFERADISAMLDRLDSAAARGELIGSPAPPLGFIWSSRPGLTSLDDFRGKVVVLDFWATTCGPCVALFPEIRGLKKWYEGSAVEVIGVTSVQGVHAGANGRVKCKDDPEREMSLMPSFMSERDMTWTVAFSQQSVYNPDYGIRGIPHMVILDPSGVVRFAGVDPASPLDEKIKLIDGLLREFDLPAPSKPRN